MPLDLTVRDLRRRWKPTKEALADAGENEALRVRIHRCCSWLAHVETLRAQDDDGHLDLDSMLIAAWAALESLYAQWDATRRRPCDARETLPEFLSTCLRLDHDGMIARVVAEQRETIVAIVTDEFLSQYFWDEPGIERARSTQRAGARVGEWLAQGQTRAVLDRLLERVELLRNQLVHGAATCGGRLNRDALERCVEAMTQVIPALLLTIIDHGAEASWGPLCYPPLTMVDPA